MSQHDPLRCLGVSDLSFQGDVQHRVNPRGRMLLSRKGLNEAVAGIQGDEKHFANSEHKNTMFRYCMHSCQNKVAVTHRRQKYTPQDSSHTHTAPENITPKLLFRVKKAMHICI